MDCELARDLERHARLVALGIEEVEKARRFLLTPEERRAIEEKAELLSRLLDRVIERRFYSAA